MSNKLFEVQTEASELHIQAECAKAVFSAFYDSFVDHANPADNALAIQARPEQYLYMAYAVEQQIFDLVERADRLREELNNLRNEVA